MHQMKIYLFKNIQVWFHTRSYFLAELSFHMSWLQLPIIETSFFKKKIFSFISCLGYLETKLLTIFSDKRICKTRHGLSFSLIFKGGHVLWKQANIWSQETATMNRLPAPPRAVQVTRNCYNEWITCTSTCSTGGYWLVKIHSWYKLCFN